MRRPGIPLSEVEILAAQLGDAADALDARDDETLDTISGTIRWVRSRLALCVDIESGEVRDLAAEIIERDEIIDRLDHTIAEQAAEIFRLKRDNPDETGAG